MSWYVYIVLCSDGSYYTGISTDVESRVAMHNAGKGAKYTRSRLPVRVVYTEALMSHSQALRREAEIKKLRRVEKQALVISCCTM